MAISNDIDRAFPRRAAEFEIMDRWNAIPKDAKASTPFAPPVIAFDQTHKIWWLLDAAKLWRGFGFFYKDVKDLMASWNIVVTSCYVQNGDRLWGTEIRNKGHER